MADVLRGDLVESRHLGHGVAVDRHGAVVAWFGDPQRVTFLRSSGKLVQALPTVESGAPEAFGITAAELAVICGSHRGEPMHVDAVGSILIKIGLGESDLQCGVHPPAEPRAAERLVASAEEPRPIHNNCSGKHAGMLALSRKIGAGTAGYSDPGHPVQRKIADAMSAMLGIDAARGPRAIDGCGVPVWAAPLANIAAFYARLATSEDGTALARIRSAMTAHPEMVSGSAGVDTLLMQAGAGDLVTKGGAEGLRCVGVRSRGLGIAIRCEDGGTRGLDPVLPTLLHDLDAIDEKTAAELGRRLPRVVHNWAGRDVGRIEPVARWNES